jgi:hypothetical protein
MWLFVLEDSTVPPMRVRDCAMFWIACPSSNYPLWCVATADFHPSDKDLSLGTPDSATNRLSPSWKSVASLIFSNYARPAGSRRC